MARFKRRKSRKSKSRSRAQRQPRSAIAQRVGYRM